MDTEAKVSRFSGCLVVVLAVAHASMAVAAELRKTPKEIYRAARDSIVVVYATDTAGQPIGQGAGFFVDDGLTIATNYHVVDAGGSWSVKLSDGGVYPVLRVRAADREADIALLVINTRRSPLKIASKLPDVGDDIIVIGHPRGYENTLSTGIVSAEGGPTSGYDFQISAPISPGNSGGPVMTSDGVVVGIATATRRDAQNLNFAQSTTRILRLLKQVSLAEAAKGELSGIRRDAPVGATSDPKLADKFVTVESTLLANSRVTAGVRVAVRSYSECAASGLRIRAKFKSGPNKLDPIAFETSFDLHRDISPGESFEFWQSIPEIEGHGEDAPAWNRWFPIVEIIGATGSSC